MSLWPKISYAGRAAGSSFIRSPFVHVVAVSALALALTGYGSTRLIVGQLAALSESVGREVLLTVTLSSNATELDREQLATTLAERTHGQARLISPAQSLDRLASHLGEAGRSLSALGENPLPWIIELQLAETSRDFAALKALAENTSALNFVQEVDFGEEAVGRLDAFRRALKISATLAFGLVFLTTIVVVAATLQLAIFARRDEIEIQKLVGATHRFIRVPFLLEGTLQGLFGAAVALAAIYGIVRWIEGDGSRLLGLALIDGQLHTNWPRLGMELIVLGGMLGLSGSALAVRRFL